MGILFEKRSFNGGIDGSVDRKQPRDQHERLCQLKKKAGAAAKLTDGR
jgi:hypothetical protein